MSPQWSTSLWCGTTPTKGKPVSSHLTRLSDVITTSRYAIEHTHQTLKKLMESFMSWFV
jgi:hypothetical protein